MSDRDDIIDLTDEVEWLQERLEALQKRLAHLEALMAVDDPLSLGDYPATDTDAQKLYQFATRAARGQDHYRRATAAGDHCAFCGLPWPCTVARRGVR